MLSRLFSINFVNNKIVLQNIVILLLVEIGKTLFLRTICQSPFVTFSALVTSIEAIEDDPVAGAAELRHVSESFEHVLFIGITCGLSAPFVGGQLEYCLDNPEKFTPVLIGFNPVSMARRTHVSKWSNDRTFYDIASRMETTSEALIINPIIGPEPISGSSRMKGGTATKVILDTVFYLASTTNTTKASEVIEMFKDAVGKMEIVRQDLATVVEQAGEW